MKHMSVPILLVLMVLTGASHLSHTLVAQEPASYCASGAYTRMLELINEHRREHDLEPLELSQPLGQAAELKAQDMAQQDYVAHVSPDGQEPEDMLEEVGYTYNTAIGENIAAGQEDVEATFEQWLNSPEHNEIMLGEQFTAIGIGRAQNADAKYDWYWAATFGGEIGEPAETCPAATPESTQDERG